MRHIHNFEEYNESKLTPYIDGVLEFYGDYYHNKITEKIAAFIEGVEWAGVNVDVKNMDCTDEEINEEVCEMCEISPKI